MEKSKSFFIISSKYIQNLLNFLLLILAVFLAILAVKELFHLGVMVFTEPYTDSFYKMFLKSVLTFFIYFEFILMIIKYYKENYHFPLRYFMYIGITATVRLIIVDHESGLETLYFSLSILTLVIGYGVIKALSILSEHFSKEGY